MAAEKVNSRMRPDRGEGKIKIGCVEHLPSFSGSRGKGHQESAQNAKNFRWILEAKRL